MINPNLEKNQKAKMVVIDEIKERLGRAKSVVLINSRGLTVAQDTTLRTSLRKAGGVDYKVYKNSMMELAIKDTDFEGLKEYLVGPTAVAFSYEDETAAASQIAKQLKTMPIIEFKASVVGGETYGPDETRALSEIPSREVLLSRLLGSFKSPMASFARVVNAIAEKDPSEAAPVAAAPAAEAPAAADEAPAVEEAPAPAEEPAAEAAPAE